MGIHADIKQLLLIPNITIRYGFLVTVYMDPSCNVWHSWAFLQFLSYSSSCPSPNVQIYISAFFFFLLCNVSSIMDLKGTRAKRNIIILLIRHTNSCKAFTHIDSLSSSKVQFAFLKYWKKKLMYKQKCII